MKTIYKTTCARLMTLLVLALLSVSNVWGEVSVTKCTSTDDLVAGNVYFISAAETYASDATVMGKSTGGNNFPTATFSSSPCELTLGGNATDGWTFSYVDGSTIYYLDPTNTTGSNYLKRNASVTDYGKFSISFSSNAAVITSKGKTSRNIIRYNSNSSCFSCYSSGSQAAIYLYKKNSTTPTTAYTVTFSAGTNGTCSTASLTEASAGAGVTLPSCTANEGYVFKGWSTTENGTTPDAGVAGETYKPTRDCTLFAVCEDASIMTAQQSKFTATSASELGDDENITYSTAKNSGTAAPKIDGTDILLYQASSGNGGSITISAVDGYKLSQVTIGSSISTSVNYTLDSNTSMSLTSAASITANGTYTISNLNNKSVTIYCMSGDKNNRLSVNYIQVKYKEEVNDGPYTITYKPNGATENEYTQEDLIKGNNITLTANTFTREGYSFAGWNTKFDGTGVSYSDGATIENISKNYTLYAQWTVNSYTLTKDAVHTPNAEAGTFKLFAGDTEVTESAQVPYGTTITISAITPATGYTFDAWRYKKEGGTWVSVSKNFEMDMPATNMEIECNFAQLDQIDIKLSDMGVVSTVQQYKTYKIADVLPKPTTEYDGFTFCGWSKTATAGTANLIGNDEVATEDITLYAVYSKTVIAANTYKKVTDISELTDGITVFIANNTGNAPKNNNGTLSSISNPAESNSEITVEDAGALWTLGKTGSGYSFTNGGKMLGSTGTTNVSFTSTNSTNWEITKSSKDGIFFIKHGDYYFEYYNSGWTGYKITSTPSTTQRDNYVGNKLYIPASETVYSLGANMTITDAHWATFCAPFNVTIPDDVKAYTVTDDGTIAFDEVETTIPAGTPVVVYSEETVNKDFAEAASVTDNTCSVGALIGTFVETTIDLTTGDKQNYVLQNQDGTVGFYQVAESSNKTIKANRCYMSTDVSTDAGVKGFVLDDIVTGISQILSNSNKAAEGIYDLNGNRLAAPQKGINIINGVKVLVK